VGTEKLDYWSSGVMEWWVKRHWSSGVIEWWEKDEFEF
jgi:hypothetical protein